MLRIMTDEDFNSRIARGVLRLLPDLDLVPIQDIGMLSASDPDILEAAANDRRVLLTHDAKTMPKHAYERIRAGEPMPGLIVCPQHLAFGSMIADVTLLADVVKKVNGKAKLIYSDLIGTL